MAYIKEELRYKYHNKRQLNNFVYQIKKNSLTYSEVPVNIKYSVENIEKLCTDVEYYIKNKKEAMEKSMVLTRHVIENHNHMVRAAQLMSFIKKHL